ncbi:hypothetical protein QR680_018019 [Steinernema hermaphroditum]|uniref:Uncharacterized protein n=1 Tax=Steinernema hermaphroditum TaxID=289476 RepID=A0AA39HGM0_9BILA|nr:hypothetical protein QR680_018019 [Steinernema hermaphroditum]
MKDSFRFRSTVRSGAMLHSSHLAYSGDLQHNESDIVGEPQCCSKQFGVDCTAVSYSAPDFNWNRSLMICPGTPCCYTTL